MNNEKTGRARDRPAAGQKPDLCSWIYSARSLWTAYRARRQQPTATAKTTAVLSPVALMTALEEAVMGFAAEETVLTLEAAALFLAALLTAALVLVLLSVVVVGTSLATTEPVSFAPLAVTSAETTILEESLVSMVGAEMETPAGSRLFIVATASLAAFGGNGNIRGALDGGIGKRR